MSIDINKIDKIDTNLVTPTVNENLIETERDKWGNILNEQTFKTLNNNIRILKEIVLQIANESNITNLKDIKLRLSNLETDRDSIENIVDNNTLDRINVGLNDRKINLIGNDLLYNGDKLQLESNLDEINIAYKNLQNTFIENVDTNKAFTINNQKVIENIENKNNIGSDNVKLNLKTTNDNIFQVNGVDFISDQGNRINIDEVIEITINSETNNGDIVPQHLINFNFTYNNPPLLLVTVTNNIKDSNNQGGYNLPARYNLNIRDITNTNFRLQFYSENIQMLNYKIYVYIINNDNNKIPITKKTV